MIIVGPVGKGTGLLVGVVDIDCPSIGNQTARNPLDLNIASPLYQDIIKIELVDQAPVTSFTTMDDSSTYGLFSRVTSPSKGPALH